MAGSVLGCPTANLATEQGGIIPAMGVYIGQTRYDSRMYPSLICISDGRTGSNLKVEVHLLDQCLDLRGKYLKVELFERLRDIIPYPGETEMARMIGEDLVMTRAWFEKRTNDLVGNIHKME